MCRNTVNPDLLFLEGFEHTYVRNALGSATSQSQTDAGIKRVEFHSLMITVRRFGNERLSAFYSAADFMECIPFVLFRNRPHKR